MCKNKKNSGMVLGAVLVGVGVAAGAYAAKKYYEKRKQLLKNYNVEVDRLQNEVDFDYSEEFLKELKKETLQADRKQISREDLLKTLNDIKDSSNEQLKKLENVLKEHLKREEAKAEEEPVQITIDGMEDVCETACAENDAIAEDADFDLEAESDLEDADED